MIEAFINALADIFYIWRLTRTCICWITQVHLASLSIPPRKGWCTNLIHAGAMRLCTTPTENPRKLTLYCYVSYGTHRKPPKANFISIRCASSSIGNRLSDDPSANTEHVSPIRILRQGLSRILLSWTILCYPRIQLTWSVGRCVKGGSV